MPSVTVVSDNSSPRGAGRPWSGYPDWIDELGRVQAWVRDHVDHETYLAFVSDLYSYRNFTTHWCALCPATRDLYSRVARALAS